MQTLTPQQFSEKIALDILILDVRQPEELALASLPGTLNIPLNQLSARVGELAPQAPIAILCHHGVRSEMAAHFLERQGFSEVSHLAGGIDAWSLMMDAGVPRY